MHARLAHNLWNVAVLEGLDDVLLFGHWSCLFILRTRVFFCLFLFLPLFEDSVRDGRLFLIQHTVDHEVVTFRGMHELDHLGRLIVQMSLIVSLLVNLFRWEDELANVDTGGACLLLHELNELLQVVFQVRALFDVGHEELLGAAHNGCGGIILLGYGCLLLFLLFDLFGLLLSLTGCSLLSFLPLHTVKIAKIL